jgi:hypothetical protein
MALEFHPAANLFPLISDDSQAFKDLVEDIRTQGQIEPIELFEGKILDGRHRYRACVAAGVEPKTATWSGDNPYAYVVSKNLHRRHLTDDQRAAVAFDAMPKIEEEAEARRRAKISESQTEANSKAIQTRLNSTASESGGEHVSRKEAAEQFQVSQDRIRRAKALGAADRNVLEEVKTGKISLKKAEDKVKKSRRPVPNPNVHIPGQVVQAPRPPRQIPALQDRLYKTIQSFPDERTAKALAREIQTENLDLPQDAIRKLTDHLKESGRGRTALARGLIALANRDNRTA